MKSFFPALSPTTCCARCKLPMQTGVLLRGSRSETSLSGSVHCDEMALSLCERCALGLDAWLESAGA